MKFLLISGYGEGCALMLKFRDEGHAVAVHLRDKERKRVYEGILQRLDNYESYLDRNTIVVFDSTGGGRTADLLRSQGVNVFGGSVFADLLEQDRDFGLAVMEECGINIPKTEKFTDWEKARTYVKVRDTRLAFKPSGKLGESIMSYVSYDAEDMIEMLNYYEEQTPVGVPIDFVLQDFVEGIAISTEGWFNGNEFMDPFNHTLEHKQMMNDNLGGSGGCSGNIVWEAPFTWVVSEGVAKLAPLLAQQGYVGPIDVNAVVNETGLYGLEFTPRFGYDAMPSLAFELYDGSFATMLADLARGVAGKQFPLKKGFASALRVTIPPFPLDDLESPSGKPIRGLRREDRAHSYLFDVRLTEKGKLVTEGSNTATFTGWGDTIEASLATPYELAERVRLPDKQYRTDMRETLRRDYEEFQRIVVARKGVPNAEEGKEESGEKAEVLANVVSAPAFPSSGN